MKGMKEVSTGVLSCKIGGNSHRVKEFKDKGKQPLPIRCIKIPSGLNNCLLGIYVILMVIVTAIHMTDAMEEPAAFCQPRLSA